nr:prepilin peptidase [Sphingomonas psychrotolerans]
MGNFFLALLLGALALVLVSAGIEDARSRNIANWKNALIALLAPLWWWANDLALWPDIAVQLGLAALVFAFFVGAFALGQMGGGDVKLLGALALWLPAQPLVGMLMLMSLIGGALTLVMLAERWTQLRGGIAALPWRTIAPIALGLAMLVALGWAGWPRFVGLLAMQPVLAGIAIIAVLAAIGFGLILAMRAARRGGIVPETPYGVAIAIATLLVLREPIFNQFT